MSPPIGKRKATRIFCKTCGKQFSPQRTWQKFCSGKCRKEDWFKRHFIRVVPA